MSSPTATDPINLEEKKSGGTEQADQTKQTKDLHDWDWSDRGFPAKIINEIIIVYFNK